MKINKILIITINLFLVMLFVINGCSSQKKPKEYPKGSEQNPLVMGFNPAESSDKLEYNANTLTKVLEEKTGLKIKTYVAESYPALVTALQTDHIDIAWLPVFAYVQAEQVADAEVLLKAVRNGDPYYYGAIVVRSDSPYKTIEDLRGKTIAWASETSASGCIFPSAAMIKRGMDPETFFGKSIVAGDHDAALLAVYHGKVDAAATFASDNRGEKGAWTQLLDEEKRGEIRPIFFTDPIPSDTMSTSRKFREANPEIIEKITAIVKGLSDSEEGKKALKDLYNIDAMIDAKSSDYDPVREAAKLLGIDIEGKRAKVSGEGPEKETGNENQKEPAEESNPAGKDNEKTEKTGG